MTKRLEKVVDGSYRQMLGMALNINQYRDHVSNHSLCGELPKVSCKITNEGSDLQVMLIDIRS